MVLIMVLCCLRWRAATMAHHFLLQIHVLIFKYAKKKILTYYWWKLQLSVFLKVCITFLVTLMLMTVQYDFSISYDVCSLCLRAVFLKHLEAAIQRWSLGFLSETHNDNFVLSISLSLGSVVPQQPVLQSDMVLLPGLHRTLWNWPNTQ